MKIICQKDTNAAKMLDLVRHLLETENGGFPLLEDDLVLEFSLKNKENQSNPLNKEILSFDEKDLHNFEANTAPPEYYYNIDALTQLYNRSKYEHDIAQLQADGIDAFTCIYMDAVGLHEVNNHLGHAAGDHMLCTIADAIRTFFPSCSSYRIGGDEFVIFCSHQNEELLKSCINELKEFLKRENFEISVGMQVHINGLSLMKTINQAEQEMRYDKIRFYQQDGGKRQLRMLNYKLEKILLEKQDASHFLNAIATEYKGVYIVNPTDDTCRYIYIPEYFNELLQITNGIFSPAIRMYCERFVIEQDRELLQKFLDFDYVHDRIKLGEQIKFTYHKTDGSNVHLQITSYDPNALGTNEMLWIFMDADL